MNIQKLLNRYLLQFIRESNQIEGIYREPLQEEVEAYTRLLLSDKIEIVHLLELLRATQPDAMFRDRPGMESVQVGRYIAPPSGPDIRDGLKFLLNCMNDGLYWHPYALYARYEYIHPFTDGNGRTGRAVWLWNLLHTDDKEWGPEAALQRGFLKTFHYQSLDWYSLEKDKR